MQENIRCADCFWFGYFRVEPARGGQTTYFIPETLPVSARQSLSSDDAFLRCLEGLRARDNRVACLCEQTEAAGQRVALEPALDNLTATSDAATIRSIATRLRECRSFRPYDPHLSYDDVLALKRRHRTNQVAQGVEHRIRRQRYSGLLKELDDLAVTDTLSPQTRGGEFEKWFGRLLAVSGTRHTINVHNNWEQIDFTVWLGDVFALGEARWLNQKVDCPQIRDFFGKLMDRPPFVIGLVFAMGGFTEPALRWIAAHTHERTILTFDEHQLRQMLGGNRSLSEIVFEMLNDRLNHPKN